MNLMKIIAVVDEFAINYEIAKGDILVTHGAAMVLLGLADTANDVDITVPQHVFDRFVENGFTPIPTTPFRMLINATEYVDIHTDIYETSPEDIFTCNGVQFTNMKRTYEDYKRLNREKDQPKLDILARHIVEIK